MTNLDSYNYNTGLGKGLGTPDKNFIRFNPPVNRFVSGAYVDAARNETSESVYVDRFETLGSDSQATRNKLKGVLYQDFDTEPAEGQTSAFGVQNGAYPGFKAQDSNRYGFKFQYNPSTIDFSISANNSTVDPALILSGVSRAMPIAPPSPVSVTFSLIINRIEDMTMLGSKSFAIDDTAYYYGRPLTSEEISGLVTKGTAYDMEFLFRTLLGRPYETDLRGSTADIGVIFGLPTILDLSPRNLTYITKKPGQKGNVSTTAAFNAGGPQQHSQRYWGRVSGISYTHREFTRAMVPMFTEVSVTFNRFPDAKGTVIGQNTSDPTSKSRTADAARLAGQAAAYAAGNLVTRPSEGWTDALNPPTTMEDLTQKLADVYGADSNFQLTPPEWQSPWNNSTNQPNITDPNAFWNQVLE